MTDTATHLIEEMFVQVAKRATVSNGSMTLVGASPSTLYFSDRPERVVGHMTTAAIRRGMEPGHGLLRFRSAQRRTLIRRGRRRHPQRRGGHPSADDWERGEGWGDSPLARPKRPSAPLHTHCVVPNVVCAPSTSTRCTPRCSGRRLSPASVRKVHVVVGKALSDAERKGITSRNVARLATPPSVSAARAPEMRCWSPDELRTFLAMIDSHRLRSIVRLAAMSGLRRGDLCGLCWNAVDLAQGTVAVRQAIIVVDGKPVLGDVKTKRSRRVVDIDPATVAELRAWRKKQLRERMLVGSAWTETGLVFTTPLGEGVHPDSLSQGFDRLVVPRRRMSDAERQRPRSESGSTICGTPTRANCSQPG